MTGPPGNWRVFPSSPLTLVLWPRFAALDYPDGPALQLMLVTGQRRQEVATMRYRQGVYNRYEYAAEKRHALEVWAAYRSNLTRQPGTNVVAMRSAPTEAA
jgi:hypothetical protein